MSEPYISRKEVDASYRPKSYVMSSGLKRAREPFRVRNALTGLVLAGFGVGVWAYSLSAVKQDVFDDVDEEARALQRAGAGGAAVVTSEVETGKVVADVTTAAGLMPFPVEPKQASSPIKSTDAKGLLVPVLHKTFPRLLDPVNKTLVWGAPPVDKMGRLSDSSGR